MSTARPATTATAPQSRLRVFREEDFLDEGPTEPGLHALVAAARESMHRTSASVPADPLEPAEVAPGLRVLRFRRPTEPTERPEQR